MIQFFLGCCFAALVFDAHAGNQIQEALSVKSRAFLSQMLGDAPLSLGQTQRVLAGDPLAMRQLQVLKSKYGLTENLPQFLATVRYEADRAGLESELVLAVIQVESNFRKYAVSSAGARGFMQVMPFWIKDVGSPSDNLFHLRTNLRYGCAILRYYLDMERGDLNMALGRFNGSRGQMEYPTLVFAAYRTWKALSSTQ